MNDLFQTQDLEKRPLNEAATIPATWYTSEDILKIEMKKIFEGTWQYVTSTQQVAKAGDYVVAEVAKKPIIIVRGNDDKIRCFYNVCRHRGGPLAYENGHGRVLQCRYHGWSYALDGRLAGATAMDDAVNFDKSKCSLAEIPVSIWENFVFVILNGQDIPLEQKFAGIREHILPISLKDKKFAQRIVYDIDANWKVYIDNYLEGFHVPFVHPGLNQLLDFKNYTTTLYDHYSLQHSPFSGDQNLYGSPDGQAFYYFALPNFMLNIVPGRLQINSVYPVDLHRTKVVFDFYYDDLNHPDAKKMIIEDLDYSDVVQREDALICENVMKGLRSESYIRGRISPKYEAGVWHFQNYLRRVFSGNLV